MWNYNLDEMPKDGTEIVAIIKTDSGNHYADMTPLFERYHGNILCWTYAPKDPIDLVIDWFDHVYPEAESAHSASYWEGLKAIRDRIEFKLAQHGRVQPVMAVSDEKVAEKSCMACDMHHYENGESVCLRCGRFRGGAND